VTCIYCGAKAERWCDFVLGFVDPDGDGLYAMDGLHSIEKCDAPLCLAHARHVGNFFASGKRGWNETVDHCHTHPPNEWWAAASSADEIDRWRVQHRARALGGLRLVRESGESAPTAPESK
jgi:hypothetical protein